MYKEVHFLTARQHNANSILCGTSGIHAACAKQKRCFGCTETRSQKSTRMYIFGVATTQVPIYF